MNLQSIFAIVIKDLKIFCGDTRSLILTLAVPIAIASFFGSLFSPKRIKGQSGGLVVWIVNHDSNAITSEIITNLSTNINLKVSLHDEPEARAAVIEGKVSVVTIFPPGFGDSAARSFFNPGKKPELIILNDPSRSMEVSMVQGMLMQHVMQSVSKRVFSPTEGRVYLQENMKNLEFLDRINPGQTKELSDLLKSVDKWMASSSTNPIASAAVPRNGMTMPFEVKGQQLTQKEGIVYNGYAHSFGGMTVQFVMMYSVEAAIAMLLERRIGLWRRLRAAPLSKASLLAGRALSCAIIGLITLAVSWTFAVIVFSVRINGSWIGFVLCNAAFALFAGALALLLATLGKSPEATRGLSIFAVLMLVMLGGAWIPSFIFPEWLQTATLITPTRWAVDALDAMTWRGLGLRSAFAPIAVLLGYAVAFGVIAWKQFRWEGE